MEGINIIKVEYTYPSGTKALRDISFDVSRGEAIAILGPNGAGKTTLIKLMNGLLKPTSGSVVVDGIDTKAAPVSRLARKVGIVFQNAEKQFFAETVYDELAFAPRNMGFQQEQIDQMVKRIANMFGIEQYLQRNPFSLSGGEKKRLSIASVLVWDPTYIIIDEPTVGLDFYYRRLLVDMIRKIVMEGKTVIVVTHDVDFALLTSQRCIILCDGAMLRDGPIFAVLSDDALITKASLVKTFTLRIAKTLLDEESKPDEVLEVINFLNWGLEKA